MTGANAWETAVTAATQAGQLSASSAENLRQWLGDSAYALYHAQLLDLVARREFATLERLFWEQIPFGTGGRRGEMSEYGSATINRRTIGESANGLAVYVKRHATSEALRAVVAHDTRQRSREFAELAATTLACHGFKVFFFTAARSTPELSFAVRHLQCATGVMISASHNPPADNGFKAYWSTGGQVLPPHDQGIIDEVYATRAIPELPFQAAVDQGLIELIDADIDAAYVEQLLGIRLGNPSSIKAVFSPLHGVGETSVYATLRAAGFDGVTIYEPQREQHGLFPNVPDQLPNPERPEVFGPAIAEADQLGAGLVLASDPDADRLAVACRGRDGQWTCLTGNQTGALLVDYICRQRSSQGLLSPAHYVVETMVTTPLIAKIAKAHGLKVLDDLLVGFKYIGEAMDQYGPDKFVFGAEESLGYLAGQYARDKDAAVAGLYVMELAAALATRQRTLVDRLHELYTEYGYHLEAQRSRTCKGPTGNQQIARMMAAFRDRPPAELGGVPLLEVRDYERHEHRSLPSNQVLAPLPTPVGNLLMVDAGDANCHLRIALRPSGTEPKIKFYFFASAAPGGDLGEVETATRARLKHLQDGLDAWIDGVLKA